MKYVELIKEKSKEAIEAVLAPIKARKAHKDLEMEMIDLEQKVAEANLVIEQEKSKCPADWKKVGEAIDNKMLLERKLGQFKEIEKELF